MTARLVSRDTRPGGAAVRQQLQAQRLQQLLDEMDEEFGSVSEAVAREVDAVAWPAAHGPADS